MSHGKPSTQWVQGNYSSLLPSSPVFFLPKPFPVSAWHGEGRPGWVP